VSAGIPLDDADREPWLDAIGAWARVIAERLERRRDHGVHHRGPADAQLGIAVLLGIAVIVLLITRWKVHAFLSLTIGPLVLAAIAGAPLDRGIASSTPASAVRWRASACSSRSVRSSASCSPAPVARTPRVRALGGRE
jgi:hypothetical protein